MVFEVKYEWEIKDFTGLSVTEKSRIYSPIFVASPDEICHRWKVCLKWDPEHSEHYGVFLRLDDKPFQQPISMHFKYRVFKITDEIVGEGELSCYHHKLQSHSGWGVSEAIECSKCDTSSIKKIVFDIKLVREELHVPESLEIEEETTPEVDDVKKPINHQSTEKLQERYTELHESKDSAVLPIKCSMQKLLVHKKTPLPVIPELEEISENNTIQLDVFDPSALNVFLKFLHTGAITRPTEKLHNIFDFCKNFKVEDLRRIFLSEMMKNIKVSTAVKFLISADKYEMLDMKKNILKFIKANLKEVMKTSEWHSLLILHVTLVSELFETIALEEG